jgi:hypothetical protein
MKGEEKKGLTRRRRRPKKVRIVRMMALAPTKKVRVNGTGELSTRRGLPSIDQED